MTAFEIVDDPNHIGMYVFTCEHASNALPLTIDPSLEDTAALDAHWGWDIGVDDLTRGLLMELGGCAVLARVSRLYIDYNRDPRSADLIVREVEDSPLSFNLKLSSHDIDNRITQFFEPFHAAVDGVLTKRTAFPRPVRLLSIHSFTPVYRGHIRDVEVGVLFNAHDALAAQLAGRIRSEKFKCELNQPYSGKPPNGLIYSAENHGQHHQIPYLELEIRQDLIETPEKARNVATRLARALRDL